MHDKPQKWPDAAVRATISQIIAALCAAIFLATYPLASIFATDAPDDALLKAEVQSLQGVWANVSASAEGVDDDSYSDLLWLTIKGDKWLMSVKKGKPIVEPAFRVDPSASPKTLDIIGNKGRKGEVILKAIYELEGDTFRYCYAIGDAERPKEFTSEPGSKSGISVYRRLKPDETK
jgi:uncharacterized protein (TIGR03067 family)